MSKVGQTATHFQVHDTQPYPPSSHSSTPATHLHNLHLLLHRTHTHTPSPARHPPTFTHVLTPSTTLLFRYSALTFNAHAIHLDPAFARTLDASHRNTLVHGPLVLTLLVSLLQRHIETELDEHEGRYADGGTAGGVDSGPGTEQGTSGPEILSFRYRNLAPLYAGEPMRLCGRQRVRGVEGGRGRESYEMWVEGHDGGVAVRGVAEVGEPRKK